MSLPVRNVETVYSEEVTKVQNLDQDVYLLTCMKLFSSQEKKSEQSYKRHCKHI